MDLGWPSHGNAGFSEKIEKNEKKIEKFFGKIFFSKKKLCHFLIPGENWGEKKIFFLKGFCSWFFDLFWPKKILMHFQRGAGGDGKMSKKWDRNQFFVQKIWPKKFMSFFESRWNFEWKKFSCPDFDSVFSTCFGSKKYLAFSASGWIGMENQWKSMKINEKSIKINKNQRKSIENCDFSRP